MNWKWELIQNKKVSYRWRYHPEVQWNYSSPDHLRIYAGALEFGTVIQAVLAEYYQSKMTGDRMLLKDIHDLFKDLWQQTAYGRDDIQYAEGKDFDTLMMNGIDLLTAWYHKLPDDDFKVIGIEEAFSFTLPGASIPIIGAIDLAEEDDSGTIIITDFKTSSRAYPIDEIDIYRI